MRSCTVVAIALLFTAACSGGTPRTAAAPKTCDPKEMPAAWSAAGPVYRSCEVDAPAKEIGSVRLRGWTPPPGRRDCLTALVEFVVDSTGRPETATAQVVRASEPGLGTALLETVPSRRYQPATKGARPVRQVVRESVLLMSTVVMVSGPRGQPAPGPSTRPPRAANCRP